MAEKKRKVIHGGKKNLAAAITAVIAAIASVLALFGIALPGVGDDGVIQEEAMASLGVIVSVIAGLIYGNIDDGKDD